MTEIVIGVLAIALAVIAAVQILTPEAHARRLMQMVAQCDERVKAHMRNNDKMLDRFMAILAPQNYHAMRQASGQVEGAQYSTKQHFQDPDQIAEELDRKRRQAEEAASSLRDARDQLEMAQAHRSPPIATAADFENLPVNGMSRP